MGKLTGRLKIFTLDTRRICRSCGEITKRESDNKYRCPSCGLLGWKEVKRIWFGVASLDIFETDIQVIFLEKAIAQLLDKIDESWQMLMDRLKGLRGLAWLEVFKDIKKEVETKIGERLVGKLVTIHGKLGGSTFVAKKLETESVPSEIGTRFTKGKEKEILSFTQKLLKKHNLKVELWDGTPVLRFSRELDGENVEIGVRAPAAEYGKSYRVWMRVNGVHMYPAKPIRIKNSEAWVLRAYHTKNWKNNLSRLLKHCRHLEEQAVRIVQAAKGLSVKKAKELLSPELSYEEKDEILRRWNNGSLWKLAEEANRINRSAGLFVLKEFGILKYK